MGGLSLFIPSMLSVLHGAFSNLGTFLSRFNTAANIIRAFHINMFGSTDVVTDMGYIEILFSYGIIFFALFIFASTKLLKFFMKHEMFVEFSIVFVYAAYTIMESYSASILMNTSLIFMSCLLFKQTKERYVAEKALT